MAEEQEQQPQPGESLDQDALDQMFGNAADGDDADQLEAMLDTLEDPSEAESADATAEEADLDGMEAILDQMESPEEDEDSEVDLDEDSEVDLNDMLYQATLADAQGDGEAGEEAEEALDLDALVEDAEEDASADDEAEADLDLDALVEDVGEEDAQAAEDLAALMGDDAEEETEEALDLDALVEDAEDAEAVEEDVLDLEALVEDEEIEEAVDEEDAQAAEDLAALMDDDAEEEGDEDLTALMADVAEEDASADGEAEADLDLDALVEDVDEEDAQAAEDLAALMGDDAEETEEALDLDALVADAEDAEAADEDALDLDALVEDEEVEADEEVEEAEDALDLDALVEDVDTEDAQAAEDLAALMGDDAEEIEETEEALDLDALVEDEEVETDETDDVDVDALLASEAAVADAALEDDLDLDSPLIDDAEEPADEDLDDLLGDLDADGLSVGVEDEVAQILTTPSEEVVKTDDSILDEFASVQDSIPSELGGSSGQGGSIMIVDGNPDNRSVFKDALSDGEYSFLDQDNPDDVMAQLAEQDVELVVVNLDDDAGGGQELVEQIISSLDLPSIPVIVNSTENDRIETALRAGAVDYLTLPLDVMDVEFQVPQKVANQIKLKKAERILAGVDVAGVDEFDIDVPTVPEVDLDTLDDGLGLDDLGLDDEVILDDDFDLDTLDDGLGLDDEITLDDDLDLDTLDDGLGFDDDLGLDDEIILDDDLSLDDEITLDDDLDLSDLDLDDDALSPDELLVGAGIDKDPLVPMSDQQKILRNRQAARQDVSRLPLFAAVALFLVAGAGLIYNYADDLASLISSDSSSVANTPMPQKPLPKVTVPDVPKQTYATSPTTPQRQPVQQQDNTFQRQADVLKSRISQNVNDLEEAGSSWWSPWRVMRASGGSVGGLVDRRSVDEILEVFGLDARAIERGLNSERTLNYLADVGYDMRGKSVDDLTGREAFELLSARQIRDSNQIIDILSDLTDRLADDRTAQAEHKERERRKQRKGHALLPALEYGPVLQTELAYQSTWVMRDHIGVSPVAGVRGSPSLWFQKENWIT